MRLFLSVRIAEEFHSKEQAFLSLDELAGLARASAYDGLCMRASQVGIHSAPQEVERAAATLKVRGLAVSMVTGDFDIVYNNDAAPDCLRAIGPHLQLARALHAPLIRVALRKEEDISWAQRAADEAASLGLKLAHQCHVESLFETVSGIEHTLRQINRPNFGLIYEPANLELCGQDYGPKTIARLAPWIFNIYLQNQILQPEGRTMLNTWCRGSIRFELIPIHASGGIDVERVFQGLADVGYRGPVTVHQAGQKGGTLSGESRSTANYLQGLAARFGL